MVVEDQRRSLGEVELRRELEGEELGRNGRLGEAPERAEGRDPVALLDGAHPPGALRTTPATSLPGTNGSGGLSWYWPRRLQHLRERHPRGVHLDDHAFAGREHVRGLGLGQLDQLECAVGPRFVDDLHGAHRARIIAVPSLPAHSTVRR